VEGEFVVAEPAELLHHDRSQHLFGAHALSTALSTDLATLAADKIVVHPFRCFRMLVEDSAHLSQFARMHVGVDRGDEHELVRQNATHRRGNRGLGDFISGYPAFLARNSGPLPI
jgi:hypothetical protein